MLTMTLFALLAMATAASAFATAAVSGAYERRYLRNLARKTAAAVGQTAAAAWGAAHCLPRDVVVPILAT